MVKEITKYCVLEDVLIGDDLYPLIIPIECTIRFSHAGWAVESINIKVENCESFAQAVQIYESILQERIAAGQIHVNMNPMGNMN